MSQWYYSKDNQPQGPITEAEIVKKLSSHELPKETLVWKEGMETWIKANKSDLISENYTKPPPAPSSTDPAIISRSILKPKQEDHLVRPASTPLLTATSIQVSAQEAVENPYQSPNTTTSPTFKEEELHTTELIYASRSIRLVAAILDNIILTIIITALLFITGGLEIVAIDNSYADQQIFEELTSDSENVWYSEGETTYAFLQDSSIGERLLNGIYVIVIYFIINGHLLAKRGQTIGKSICNIQIVNYNTGKVPDMIALGFTRYFCVQIASSITFLFALVNVLFIFSEEKRCLHDRMANTKVVLKGKSTREYTEEYQ